MILRLKRFSYSRTETEGVLIVGHDEFATVERPWVPNPDGAKGGAPGVSCIPDGMYRLKPHTRPNGDSVFIIFNPDNGVHLFPSDHPKGAGRDLILIHAGNTSADVEGCIAPGISRSASWRGVEGSQAAMARLRALLGGALHILSITNDTGAVDGYAV